MTRPYSLGGPTRAELIARALLDSPPMDRHSLAALTGIPLLSLGAALTEMRHLGILFTPQRSRWTLTDAGRAWITKPSPLTSGQLPLPKHQRPKAAKRAPVVAVPAVREGAFIPAPTKARLMAGR